MLKPKLLITGGAGFIGSAFVRLVAKTDRFSKRNGLVLVELIVVDKLTYAGDLKRLQGLIPKGTVPKE